MWIKRNFNQISIARLFIVSILTHFAIWGENAFCGSVMGQEAVVPCVMTRDAACLGYPWAGMECVPEDALILRGQSDPENAAAAGISETGSLDTFSDEGMAAGSSSAGMSSSWGTSGELPLYSPSEEQYHYWDPAFRACIPGFGRPLPTSGEAWTWQALPGGTLYRAHFASNRESRLGIHFINEDTTHDAYWDPTLGGRINFLRYGTVSILKDFSLIWNVPPSRV